MTPPVNEQASLLAQFRRWCTLALESLGDAREEIDALNVFPVADSDTGTNLYLTLEAAVAAVDAAEPADFPAAIGALGRGALLGARGNSGVILSQLLRAMASSVLTIRAPRSDADGAAAFAQALTDATDAAYRAVAQPVEGTMLTVARAAAQAAAATAAEPSASVVHSVRAAAGAAREALTRTPGQLDVLRQAGVVDAGGRGVCVLLDAAETALTGRRPRGSMRSAGRRARTLPLPHPVQRPADATPGGGFEVMYLLDADDDRIAGLRAALAPLGDSLVVVGGDGLWNVHIHVDDVGAALEAGVRAGVPRRVRVTHLAERDRVRHERTTARGVVVVAAGPGLTRLFADAGGTVVEPGPDGRCSASQLLDAIRRTAASEVVVMPNDGAGIAVAEAAAQAARDIGIRATVIPTRAQVQGLAAMAVHAAGRSFEDDVVAMTSAAGHTRHGAVTLATSDAMTTAGPCRAGDALGVIDGDFAVVGAALHDVALEVVDRLLAGGGEMVTIVTGEDEDGSLVEATTAHVRTTHPEIDAVVYSGGQSRYPLLIAVE
jgi:DAK2 domain fusion protein YloV